MKNNLTVKKEKFVLSWFETGNKTEAYKQAYDVVNMSDKTIKNKAYELSKKGNIRGTYEELQDRARKRNDVTVDRLIRELSYVAFSNFSDMLNENGTLKPINELTKAQKAAIKEIKKTDEGYEYKLHDKINALDKLGRYLGIYERDNTLHVKGTEKSFSNSQFRFKIHADNFYDGGIGISNPSIIVSSK